MSCPNLENIPVYRKAISLRRISREMVSYITYNKDLLKLYQSNSLRDHIADSLLTDAILIPQQIEQAESSQSYSVKMNSVDFINTMTRNLLSYCKGLEVDGVKEKEYINLLRNEIRTFRKSFKGWRQSLRNNNGGYWKS